MVRVLAGGLGLLLLAACGVPQWNKPGATHESTAADLKACAGSRVEECMRGKGYTDEAHMRLVGTYEAVLPAASGGGERHVRVTLETDGTASVTSAFSGKPSRFLAEGTWTMDGRAVTVRTREESLVFHHAGGDQLVAREWDRARWGEKGPGVLYRVIR